MTHTMKPMLAITAVTLFIQSCTSHKAKTDATNSTVTSAPSSIITTAPAIVVQPSAPQAATMPAAIDATIRSYHVSLGWPSNTTLKNCIVLTTGETYTLNDAANHAEQVDVITESHYDKQAGLFAPTSLESTKGWTRRRGSRVSVAISSYSREAFDAIGNAQQVHAIGAGHEPSDEKTELNEGSFYIAKTFEGKYAIIAVTKAIGNPSDPMSTVDLDIKCEQ